MSTTRSHPTTRPPMTTMRKTALIAGLAYIATFVFSTPVKFGFWTDVLDARFHGATSSYAMLNAGFGVRLAEDRITAGVKLVNLNNDDAQQHIFGDIIKRQIVGELKYRFR